MKHVLLLTMTFLLASIQAKTPSAEPPAQGRFSGGDHPGSPSLVLNNDRTFVYRDESNPEKPINTSGSWELKGNTILLTSTDTRKFHHKWKWDGQCMRSRKGMTFYRLCPDSPAAN